MPATAIYFLYHLILEPLMSGRTPGKRMIGAARAHARGPGAHGRARCSRAMCFASSIPCRCSTWSGLLFVMFGRRHLRLGDLAAGTVLAMERAPFLEKLAAQRGAPARAHGTQAASAPRR